MFVVVGAVVAAVLALVVPALSVPDRVEQLTIDNPHPWTASVDLVGRDGEETRLGLGAVDRGTDQTFRDVLDQGDEWTLRFTHAGQQVDVTVSRADLETAGWKVAVPDDFAGALEAAGVPESAF